ncbi:hypothetical protein B0H17DRAFT_1108656 [Mycena rosella]|uniref:Uncharacterized protein n=1 Tax=Mycena rosella TaxID=1033263 RepID=A0AAD7BV72_MYCRO|nr:hypothetical protein B0H17DRAFT_1108656 [Mycena rosella]
MCLCFLLGLLSISGTWDNLKELSFSRASEFETRREIKDKCQRRENLETSEPL